MNIYYYICHHLSDQIHVPWRTTHESDSYECMLFGSIPEESLKNIHRIMQVDYVDKFGPNIFSAGHSLTMMHNSIMSHVMLTAVDYMEYNRARTTSETLET